MFRNQRIQEVDKIIGPTLGRVDGQETEEQQEGFAESVFESHGRRFPLQGCSDRDSDFFRVVLLVRLVRFVLDVIYVHRSEITPVLSAYDSISKPINCATVSHRFEFSVPLFILTWRPCLIWPCPLPATIIGRS